LRKKRGEFWSKSDARGDRPNPRGSEGKKKKGKKGGQKRGNKRITGRWQGAKISWESLRKEKRKGGESAPHSKGGSDSGRSSAVVVLAGRGGRG